MKHLILLAAFISCFALPLRAEETVIDFGLDEKDNTLADTVENSAVSETVVQEEISTSAVADSPEQNTAPTFEQETEKDNSAKEIVQEPAEGNVQISKDKVDPATDANLDEKLSFYAQKLNLTSEQIDMARYISNEGRLKLEQLSRSLDLLKAQAQEMEAKSLNDFEAILTDEQRETFSQLRKIKQDSLATQ